MKAPTLTTRFPKGLPALGIASLVAGATEGYGQVVYTPVNGGAGTTVANGVSIDLYFDGDASPDAHLYFTTAEGGYVQLYGTTENPLGATDLSSGYSIRGVMAGTLIDSSGFTTKQSYLWGSASGSWYSATSSVRGYIPVEFRPTTDNANYHYGWIDLQINRSGTPDLPDVILYGYAYEATAGVAINAGAVPEPGTSAAIIGGAAALLALRRRRKSEVAA